MFKFFFCKPQADKIAAYLKEKHPSVPTVYFGNGGSCFLHAQNDMKVIYNIQHKMYIS